MNNVSVVAGVIPPPNQEAPVSQPRPQSELLQCLAFRKQQCKKQTNICTRVLLTSSQSSETGWWPFLFQNLILCQPFIFCLSFSVPFYCSGSTHRVQLQEFTAELDAPDLILFHV